MPWLKKIGTLISCLITYHFVYMQCRVVAIFLILNINQKLLLLKDAFVIIFECVSGPICSILILLVRAYKSTLTQQTSCLAIKMSDCQSTTIQNLLSWIILKLKVFLSLTFVHFIPKSQRWQTFLKPCENSSTTLMLMSK